MRKRQAKQLVWQLTKGGGSINMDKELWTIYYRVPQEDFILKERNWRWEVVLKYHGKILFKAQIDNIQKCMLCEDTKTKKMKFHKFPFSISFETKEVVIW